MELLGLAAFLLVLLLTAGWLSETSENKPSRWEIQKLKIQDGDVLVVRIKDEDITLERWLDYRNRIEFVLGKNVKVMVFFGDVELSVLEPSSKEVAPNDHKNE